MKKSILLIVLLAAINAPALTLTAFENAFDLKSAEVIGAGNCLWYNEGQDTLAASGRLDSTGHDSLFSTQAIQIGPVFDDGGTTWWKSSSDSIAVFGASQFWLWFQLDTTTFGSGITTGYSPLNGSKDSLGISKIWLTFALVPADTGTQAGWLADSLNIILFDDAYNSINYNQHWLSEDRILAVAGWVKRWYILNAPVPACIYVRIWFEAVDTIRELTVVKWRFVGIR